MGDTSRDTQRSASRCYLGRGGGIRPVARLSEGGHLTREAACCELQRLVHCSTTVLNHGLCRKIPLLSLGRGGRGGGGEGGGGGGGRGVEGEEGGRGGGGGEWGGGGGRGEGAEGRRPRGGGGLCPKLQNARWGGGVTRREGQGGEWWGRM